MKTKVFLLTGIMIAAVASAQQPTLGENDDFSPTFRSGKSVSFYDFLRERVHYPESDKQLGHQGTVVIGFIVTANGELKDFTVINSVSPKSDREVIRAIKSTNGKWMPGNIEGKPVDMQHEASVIFKLYPENNFIASAKKYIQKGNQKLFVENRPKRALASYNRGIRLLPNDMTLLAMRSLCNQRLGDSNSATRDIERIAVLAEKYGSNFDLNALVDVIENSENLHGFSEFRSVVEKK